MLRESYPHLTTAYDKMYRKPYAPKEYTSMVLKAVDKARWEWGLQVMEPTKDLRGRQRQLELALTA